MPPSKSVRKKTAIVIACVACALALLGVVLISIGGNKAGVKLVRISIASRLPNRATSLKVTTATPALPNISAEPTVQDFISRLSELVILDNNAYFSYVAAAMHNTFTQLGINHTISKTVPAGANGTFITCVTHDLSVVLPQHYISYNFEQLTTDKPWPDQLWQRFSAAQMVWDYSLENIKVLNTHGINNTYHVPLGYDQTMESKAAAAAPRDIDVVFAGAMNSRRQAKLAQLQGPIGPNGTTLRTNFRGAWGDDLLVLYMRSKVALNLHFYGGRTILEVHRILPIIISKTLVLSEPSNDQWLDGVYQFMVNFTTGEDMRQSVVSMLSMDVEQEVERRYQHLLQCCRYVTYFVDILSQPYPRHRRSLV